MPRRTDADAEVEQDFFDTVPPLARPDLTAYRFRLTDSNTNPRSAFESFQRVGYYDFRAYAEPLSTGGYQGFVLVRHHTLAGLQQTIFRAGGREALEASAFTSAELKVAKLKAMIGSGISPLDTRK